MKKFKQLNSVLSVVFKYAISTKHRVGYGYFNRRILINIFFICFLYHFQDSFGQNIQKRDSSYFYLKAFEFSNNNNDSLIFYAKKIQQSNNRCQRVDGILYEAKGFYGKIDFKNSRRLAYKAIQQSKIDTKVCDKKNLIDAYGRLFYISKNQGKYDSAIYHSQKYLSSFEDKQAFNKFSIYILDNLANIYYSKNIPDSALKYSNLTLEKYKEFEEKKRKTFIKIHADELDDIKRMNEKLIQNSEESNLFEYSIIVMIPLSSSILLYIKNKRVKPKEKKKRKDIDGNLRERILRGLSDFELSEIFLESEFTINSLAEYLETNTTYLSTVINNDKKKSFKQYLAELRINYAIQKLKNDRKFIKYSISSIVAEVGYTNASAFARIFKKQTGKTPSEFIKLINLENSAKANK